MKPDKTQGYLGCTVFSEFNPLSDDFGLESRVYDSQRTCHSENDFCAIVTLCGKICEEEEISQCQDRPRVTSTLFQRNLDSTNRITMIILPSC